MNIIHGDCLRVLPELAENSFDSCVTDPPYHIGFIGKAWDGGSIAMQPETWAAALRVLKPGARRTDSGSAARFFDCAKASKADREEGCEHLPDRTGGQGSETSGQHITRRDGGDPKQVNNNHPTVKPRELMRYLCRLVTPPGGGILDPFCGSGSTGKAAVKEGFEFCGIEKEAEYIEIARARIMA